MMEESSKVIQDLPWVVELQQDEEEHKKGRGARATTHHKPHPFLPPNCGEQLHSRRNSRMNF